MTTLTQTVNDMKLDSQTVPSGNWVLTGLRRWAKILMDHMSEGAYRMNSEHISCVVAEEWIYRGRL